jgi:hypothetical protein
MNTSLIYILIAVITVGFVAWVYKQKQSTDTDKNPTIPKCPANKKLNNQICMCV